MRFHIEGNQIFMGVLFFSTMYPVIGAAIYGFGNMHLEKTLNAAMLLLVQGWIYLTIPITVYIAIFTKFNNPFAKRQRESK